MYHNIIMYFMSAWSDFCVIWVTCIWLMCNEFWLWFVASEVCALQIKINLILMWIPIYENQIFKSMIHVYFFDWNIMTWTSYLLANQFCNIIIFMGICWIKYLVRLWESSLWLWNLTCSLESYLFEEIKSITHESNWLYLGGVL